MESLLTYLELLFSAHNLETFSASLLSGISVGAVYASLALALVMIHRATELINFAQAEMAMFATYIAYALITIHGFPYWVAFFVTIVGGFVLGVACQRFIIRPVEKSPILTIVIVFIALLVMLNAVVGWRFTYTTRTFPSPFPQLSVIGVSYHEIGIVVVTMIVLTMVFLFFRYTPIGLAMRGAALNPDSSRLVGIRVGWMLALGWGLASAIGAVAGMMVAPIFTLDPNMMGGVLLYAFAAALVGGVNSPGGAVVGGFIVGITENLVGQYIGTDVRATVALILIVGVLVIKPSGLFGKTVVQRV